MAAGAATPGALRRRRGSDEPAAPASFTAEQVRAACRMSGRVLVVFDGFVYDVSSVAAGHPGGAQLITARVGEDISQLFRGKVAPWHAHSKAAHRCLEALRVGVVCDRAAGGAVCEPPFPALGGGAEAELACGVDSARAMVFQVGKLGQRYQEWLGAPCLASEPLRMFDNAFMEAASKTPWWTVPLLWLPLALYSLWSALVQHAAPPGAAAAHAAAGLLAWALVEYALHRFVFHAKPTGYWAITLHFSFHGCHHKHPSDRLRLVFPPLFAAPLVAGFRAAIASALAAEPGLGAAFFAGMLSGYVAYDCMHYFSHHAASPPRWMARSRKAHLEHHFVDSMRGFGVSGDLFDRVFGTLPRRGA